ncbi:MAG: hypothetical protein ACI396_04560 [Acutalibacteraceae bacterium]
MAFITVDELIERRNSILVVMDMLQNELDNIEQLLDGLDSEDDGDTRFSDASPLQAARIFRDYLSKKSRSNSKSITFRKSTIKKSDKVKGYIVVAGSSISDKLSKKVSRETLKVYNQLKEAVDEEYRLTKDVEIVSSPSALVSAISGYNSSGKVLAPLDE